MKISEISEDNEIDNGTLYDFLKKKCSEFLKETAKPLYRGFNEDDHQDRQSFIISSRNDRTPRDTSVAVQTFMDNLMKDAGLIATRSNSFFCTGAIDSARNYGDVYRIYPINGYKFSWSPIIQDFYTDFDTFLKHAKAIENPEYVLSINGSLNGVLKEKGISLDYISSGKYKENKIVNDDIQYLCANIIDQYFSAESRFHNGFDKIEWNKDRLINTIKENYKTTDMTAAIQSKKEIMIHGSVLAIRKT